MRGKPENFSAQARLFSHPIRILHVHLRYAASHHNNYTHLWIINIFSMYHCQNLLNDACRGFAMSCADHRSGVLCWQGLNCQQVVTPQVWKRGLLIMFRDSSAHIPNIVSLNTAILKAKSSFTWHPLPCWMSHCVKLYESPFWADLWKHVQTYSNIFLSHVLVFELVVVYPILLLFISFYLFVVYDFYIILQSYRVTE